MEWALDWQAADNWQLRSGLTLYHESLEYSQTPQQPSLISFKGGFPTRQAFVRSLWDVSTRQRFDLTWRGAGSMLLVEPRVGTAEVVAEYGALAKVGCLRVVDGNMAAASLLRDEVDLVLVDTQAEPPKGRTWAELAAEAGQGKVWVSLGPLGDRDIQAPFQRHLSRPVSRQELLELLVAPREEGPAPVVSRESPVRYSGRVLLVEDNPVNQEVTRGLLEYCGCAVVVVGDGQEALDTWEQGDFDLILMP